MGRDLLETLIHGTGLPDQGLRNEMNGLLAKNGKSPESLTIDDLREVLADYLQDVMLEMKERGL